MEFKTKLSILCLAYNHAKYIRQALDGFVMQKTNFPFEVIIHDDASTDGTAEIIREYQHKYPNIIKPIFQKENQFSKGKEIITEFLLPHIKGEYVALNEGDDYWTDENKLQKQVDFLDSHPNFTICFHPVNVVWEDKSQPDTIFPEANYRFNKKVLTLDDLLKHNFIQTNSVVYRWKLTKEMWPKSDFLPIDYMWHLIHAKFGKIGFLPDLMAVYRKNQSGIWNGCGVTDDWFLRCGIKHIRFYQVLEKMFHVDKSEEIKILEQSTVSVLIKHEKWHELEVMIRELPDILRLLFANKNEWSDNGNIGLLQSELDRQCRKLRKLKKKNKKLKICVMMLVFALVFAVIVAVTK